MRTLFTWIHLSDVQLGHGDAGHAADQRMILAELRKDIARILGSASLRPDAILVTGDIAWAGKAEQYAEARAWLGEVATTAGVEASRIYVVPGNHDVDHSGDGPAADRVDLLRSGGRNLDETLASAKARELLRERFTGYLDFTAGLAPVCRDLFWVDHLDAGGGLRVRLVGLNTALLSAEKDDHGKLRLGKEQIATAVLGKAEESELVVVLSHHPFSGGWLADEGDAGSWIRSGVHMHLFGHVKDASSEEARSGAGGAFVRLAAGAAHRGVGEPPRHGYAIGAVVARDDGSLCARIWPRQWADKVKCFREDVDNLPDGGTYAEHPLRLRLSSLPVPVPVSVPALEVSTARLPPTNRELFGRKAEFAWLDACWKDGVRVASIVAFGGVGKTALVNAWLLGMDRDGWRGAQRVYAWSFYSQGTDRLSSSDEFFSDALKSFGDPNPTEGSPWDKGERLAKLVKRERILLILDGLEPLQWGPGAQPGKLKDPALEVLVKNLGAQNKGLCLITSRIALTDLEALVGDKVRMRDLAHLSPEAGAELLKARGAKGTDEELREAAKEYKGHGLALTLLGSYLADVAKGDIRRRKEIGPLEQDERQGGHARRVMAAYKRWLKKPEVAILEMIGLFDRPVDEDEIATLRAKPVIPGLTVVLLRVDEREWNKAVAKLRRVGLLAAEQDKRLDAHPLVREHFKEQLRREQPNAWREGHRRLYEHLKKNAKPFPETIEEMAPLYAAVAHGCLAGRSQEALDELYWRRINRARQGFNWSRLGAFGSEVAVLSSFFDPPWERLAPGLDDLHQGSVLNNAGFGLRALGRLPEAAVLMRMAVETNVAQEDWKKAAGSASNFSGILQAGGDLSEALVAARQCVELANKSEDAFLRMMNLTTLAAAMHSLGRLDDATALFVEAERMQKERQPAHLLLYSLQGFRYCDFLLDQGRDAEVQERAAKAMEVATSGNRILDIALDHLSLGRAHLLAAERGAAGDLTQATSHLAQAVDGLQRAGQQDHLPRGFFARAALRTHTRAFADARRDLDEALTLAIRCGFRLHEADAHLGHARLALAEGNPTAARDHLALARAIIEATGYHRRDGELADLDALLQSASAHTSPPTVAAPIVPLPPPPAAPSFAKPMSTLPAAPQTVDLGIVVALQEEFRELLALSGSYTPHKDDVLTSYRFERGPYRVVVAFVGDMGEVQATRVTERLITLWQPACIVVVGIAAGVHDDLRVGDVYVPPQAVQYLQDAKASPKKGKPAEFTLVPGAPAYRADHALLDAVRTLEFDHPDAYRRWRADCCADLESLVPDAPTRERLFDGDLVRRELTLLANGHVATGPVVGAAAAFSAWIRSHDRNVKALEMESAAVLLAAQTRGTPKRALAIRGISDYGDPRKQALDAIGGGSLRRYAMRNAVRLLWSLLDVGALPRGSETQNPT